MGPSPYPRGFGSIDPEAMSPVASTMHPTYVNALGTRLGRRQGEDERGYEEDTLIRNPEC
jgi:hypothetical protein